MEQNIKVYVVGRGLGYANWIPNRELVKTMEEADLVMFTGGADINPALYNEDDEHRQTYHNPARDFAEVKEWNEAVNQGKHIIGICRGAQLATAMSGGRLIQHVNNHAGRRHEISFSDGETHTMNSLHHQMCWPYSMDEKDYEIVAHTTEGQATTYEFNNVEKYNKLDKPEPEIIYFNNTKALAIQGHPEMMGEEAPAVKKIKSILLEKLSN